MFNESRLLNLQHELNIAREKLSSVIGKVSRKPEGYEDAESLLHELTVMMEFSEAYGGFLTRMIGFSRHDLHSAIPESDIAATSAMLDSVENFPKLVNSLDV